MDTETGKIHMDLDADDLRRMRDQVAPVSIGDMTEKQKEEKQVSRYDTTSKLGKLFTECRRIGWSGLSNNQRRNLKQKLGLK